MKYNKHKSRKTTPWDGKELLSADELFIQEYIRDAFEVLHKPLRDTNEAAFINSFSPSKCPRCNSEQFKKNGFFQSTGIQKYYCKKCKKNFSVITNTIFDNHKISLSEWIEYILETINFQSNKAISFNRRNSESTTPYWLHKLFMILEGYQDNILLYDRVQIDETFYSVIQSDLVMKNGKKLRGISKNKYLIGIGTDNHGNVYLSLEGKGKPTVKSTEKAFLTHIRPGSHLIHDSEHSHDNLVKKLNLEDEKYNSKSISKLPDQENPLYQINHMCFLLKDFLDTHRGFDRGDLEGYLNLFSFMMNPPNNKLEKVRILLNRAIDNPKILRYRDFYKGNDDY